MLVNELYKDNDISIESYLELNGVKDWKNYIHPNGKYIDSPFDYVNMIEGIQLLKYHYLQETPTYLICDSDFDGYASTYQLYDYMKKLNPKWNIKILLHKAKKRSVEDIDIFNHIVENFREFIIISDAGSNSKDRVNELVKLGAYVLVIDHHKIEEGKKVENCVLISNQVGNVDRYGSGGVVVNRFLKGCDIEFDLNISNKYLDIVALSIISDSMNVSSMQNREYLYWGLFKNNNCIKNNFIKRLFEEFINKEEYTQKDISWNIVPKFNSVIRLKNQENKQKLLLAMLDMNDFDEVIDICKESHEKQKETVAKIVEQSKDIINNDNNIIIYNCEDMPSSYSGLVAGKLLNEFDKKPCIVGKIKEGSFIGSLRSPIPLKNILNESKYVEFAQGHDCSCGLEIKENNIQPLQEYLNSLDLSYEPNITVLKSYTPKSIPSRLFPLFEPYRELWSNSGLPIPTFHFKNINITNQDISIIGASKRVLKWKVGGVEFVKFNCLKEDKVNLKLGHYENDTFVSNKKKEKLSIEVIGTLGVNEWNGNKTNQVIIDKIEVKDREDMSLDDIF